MLPKRRWLLVLGGLVSLTLPVCLLADEPFTPSGATQIEIKVGGTTGFLFKPTQDSAKTDRPWLWYAPTLVFNRPANKALPNARTHWLFSNLLARGIWIAGVDVGESYGAPAGRAIYSEFYKVVTAQYHLSSQPCLLVQSRGGLMGTDWAEENPGDVRCIAGIYPVFNLASWPPAGSPLFAQAAAAYGYASQKKFTKHLVKLSPLAHAAPLANAKIPVFILHGDSDRTVPIQQNSQPFVKKYVQLGGDAELQIVPGKGHQEVNEFSRSDRLLQFLIDRLAH